MLTERGLKGNKNQSDEVCTEINKEKRVSEREGTNIDRHGKRRIAIQKDRQTTKE